MKPLVYIIIVVALCNIWEARGNRAVHSRISEHALTIEDHILALEVELTSIREQYAEDRTYLQQALLQTRKGIDESITMRQKLHWLLERDRLKENLQLLRLNELSDVSKVRYIKGLQIIKILYEKTLALDHHFASIHTFHEINKISNPNQYPEFLEAKENIAAKRDKKSGFDLTKILGNNIYASVTHSLISLFGNSSSKQEKEQNLEDVECILDFTLRMHHDLNTIYFETAFLQKSNSNVILELEQLFVDFTKPIKYKTPLKDCRNSDDWDLVRENLNKYLEVLDEALMDESKRYKAHKMQINLEFPIDRLLQFITQYNAFIDQGGKFYEKFGIMLNSYENEKQCATKLPIEYKKLKDNVSVAIEKFNTAYKPVEINGSKMKEILYGLNEYD